MTKITLWRRGDAHPESWPQWLRDADIDHCHVEIDGGTVIWHGGIWHGGIWFDRDGVWHVGGPPVYRDEEAQR